MFGCYVWFSFVVISELLKVIGLLLPTQHLAIACHWSQRAAVIGDVVQVYSGSHGRTIVFCETKKDANELSMNTSIKQVPETCIAFIFYFVTQCIQNIC